MCAALGAGTAAYAAGGAQPSAGTTGEIRGRVVDHTAPVHPLAGRPVRLEVIEPAFTSTRVATTDSQGRFDFPGLPVGGPRVFLVQVEYGGVPYTAKVVLTAAVPVRTVPLPVYTATTDRAVVHGTVAFAVLELLHDALRVSVIQRLYNATDRVVAVTDRDPLVFPLPLVSPVPRAAEPVEFVDGWHDPHVKDRTITDAIPVMPGATQVAYAVGVEPRTRAATLEWEFPYGATDVEVLADPTLRVSGAALHAGGVVAERGRRYGRWSGGPVPAGGTVSVRLDGLPVVIDRWPGILAGGLALALACGLVLALRRDPAPPRD